MTDNRDTFWKRLEGINAGMLGAEPDWRLVPMSHYAEQDSATLWFITAQGTDLVEAVEGGAKKAVHAVADADGQLYARIEGKLELSNDKAKLDEVWNAVASSWFGNDERDPDVRLLRFTMSEAEVWTTAGRIGFFYEIAKSKITGTKPDTGDHFTVSF